jgi:hypothetical protein
MLNANLAFLAIQSVDVNRNPYRSPAQTFSYLSVTANIGSIVLGLLLMRHNRTESQADDIVSHYRLSILSYLPMHAKSGNFLHPFIIHS